MHARKVSGRCLSIWQAKPKVIYTSWQSKTFTTTTQQCMVHQEEQINGSLSRTRNIGIIAHIDAGKTTTTERMLFYSGHTRRIGDVDDGSTVTDFLPAERARGITIQSAAITFHWPPLANQAVKSSANAPLLRQDDHSFTINLIDTPGHADFTFEVLRSLRILDGAVCILDGVAGVEAQTEKVWTQAQSYQIPKIIYINKLDRDGATFGRTVKEIATKLHAWPALCQIPWYDGGEGTFVGVVDVVNLRALRWAQGDGTNIVASTMEELQHIDPSLALEARRARIALVELISEYDDAMVEKYLERDEDHMAIEPNDILSSLRRILRDGKSPLVPVFAGASFRNIGVQPLLDAITQLLPSPGEVQDTEFTAGPIHGSLRDLTAGKLSLAIVDSKNSKSGVQTSKKATLALAQHIEACALAFKVVQDSKRGILVYVRVYHGTILRNASLYNTALQVCERAPRLLHMYAQDAVEVSALPAGHIGVITGLKHTRTGDTLIVHPALTAHSKATSSHLSSLALRPIAVPPPLFFASIEPYSLRDQANVTEALNILLREDPSLHVSMDSESGQTLLSGMGELHLEIARDRLVQDLQARCAVGRIEISYRETPTTTTSSHRVLVDRIIAGRTARAACRAVVSPLTSDFLHPSRCDFSLARDGNLITITIDSPTSASTSGDASMPHLPPNFHSSLHSGALAALARSPNYFLPLHATHVNLTCCPSTDLFGADSTPAALSAAARTATHTALKAAAISSYPALVEPVMLVHIDVDERSLGSVVQDLSARGGIVIALGGTDSESDSDGDSKGTENPPRRRIDPARVYAPRDPFGGRESGGESGGPGRTITARVPLREMLGYLRHLRSLTGGRGGFVMSVDGFEKVGGQRTKAILLELRGEVG